MIETVVPGVVLLAVFAGALVQAATGMGFSLVVAPVMVLALGPRDGIPTTLALAALSSVVPLLRDRRHIQPAPVTRLLLPTLACTPLIAWAVHGADTRWLALAGGIGVVIAVALLASGLRSQLFRTPAGAVATGASSAVLNVVGGVGGPPIGLYVANTDWDPPTTRANLHAFFLIQNAVTCLILGTRMPGAAAIIALCAGTAAGMVLASRITPSTVRTGVLAVSLLGGLGLVSGAF